MNYFTLGFVNVWARQLKVFRACAAARGERAQAADYVAGVYSRFTAGFGSADLVNSKATLDELDDAPNAVSLSTDARV
jgi:hypothetical protein